MKFIFSNITYLRKKERKSTLLLISIIVCSSFTDNVYMGIKTFMENHKKSKEIIIADKIDEKRSYPNNSETKSLSIEETDSKFDSSIVFSATSDFSSISNSNSKPASESESASTSDSASASESESVSESASASASEPFDPNTSSSEDLIKYGLSEFAARNLIKYRNAGGTFKTKGEILKIYGIDTIQYRNIEHLIDLPEQAPMNKNNPIKKYQKIDINTASASDFSQFQGIGDVLSNRILKYREKLGGFYDIEQLKEVYGIQDSVITKHYEYLSLETAPIKININGSDERALWSHPYIGSKLAKIIVNYRIQNGQYFKAEDLLKIEIIDEQWLNKISPYLDY